MKKRRILFLGETYRADAITWMKGLEEFGDFEIVSWELKNSNNGINRFNRLLELAKAFLTIKSIAKKFNPDMVIAERTTSYGFLAVLSGVKPTAIAQQGITDLWPENAPSYPLKKIIQKYAFKKADLIHAWGNAMAIQMEKNGADMSKVMVLPKGINLSLFQYNEDKNDEAIHAIVTRSLYPEYKHNVILKAFAKIKVEKIPFSLTLVGDGPELNSLRKLASELNIEKEVFFLGKIDNNEISNYLQKANFYISMPVTEGVSASLFEAMACGCFPIISDLIGNRHWIQQKVNGILVESENESKLAEEIQWAFHNLHFTKKAIKENRKFVEENANYEKNMKIIAQTYHELITKSITS